MAFHGVVGVLLRPRYAVLAVCVALAFAFLVYLMINWGIYGSLLLSRLSFVDKLAVVGLMSQRLLTDLFTTVNGGLLLVVSVMQGMSIATTVYVMRRNKQFGAARTVGGSGFAAVAAALGLGCVPCGTSIMLPLVSIFFSSSAYMAASIASGAILALAFIATSYSLYTLGNVAYTYRVLHEQTVTNGGKDKAEK